MPPQVQNSSNRLLGAYLRRVREREVKSEATQLRGETTNGSRANLCERAPGLWPLALERSQSPPLSEASVHALCDGQTSREKKKTPRDTQHKPYRRGLPTTTRETHGPWLSLQFVVLPLHTAHRSLLQLAGRGGFPFYTTLIPHSFLPHDLCAKSV